MKRFLALALLVILAACQPTKTGDMHAVTVTPPAQRTVSAPDEPARLTTSDGVSIAYFYLPAKNPDAPGVILLHMLSRSKEDYAEFAQRLQDDGFAVIAIDFRGHGKSQGDVKQFTDQDFKNLVKDVKAAKDFLAAQGVTKIGIVGASIGANTALQYAVTDPDIKAVVLLSPGEDYHGVTTEDVMGRYPDPVLLIAAHDDRASAVTVQRLEDLAHVSAVQVYPAGGHGTRLFATTNAERLIIDWLEHYLVRGVFK